MPTLILLAVLIAAGIYALCCLLATRKSPEEQRLEAVANYQL